VAQERDPCLSRPRTYLAGILAEIANVWCDDGDRVTYGSCADVEAEVVPHHPLGVPEPMRLGHAHAIDVQFPAMLPANRAHHVPIHSSHPFGSMPGACISGRRILQQCRIFRDNVVGGPPMSPANLHDGCFLRVFSFSRRPGRVAFPRVCERAFDASCGSTFLRPGPAMTSGVAEAMCVSTSRFILDRAASLAIRVWVLSIALFGTALLAGVEIIQAVRQLPWWVWPLVALVVVPPVNQARSWTRAAAAKRGQVRWKGRIALLFAFEAANYSLLYLLGVAPAGEALHQAHMNEYVKFMMSAGANYLTFLAAFYCTCALRIPIMEQLAPVISRQVSRMPARREQADVQ
jgi:hypothetical protein